MKTPVEEHTLGATVQLRGADITVELRAEVDPARCVGWTYADPAGHTSEVVNCSVARTALHIKRPGATALQVTAPVSAYETGGPRRAIDVPLQPFPD